MKSVLSATEAGRRRATKLIRSRRENIKEKKEKEKEKPWKSSFRLGSIVEIHSGAKVSSIEFATCISENISLVVLTTTRERERKILLIVDEEYVSSIFVNDRSLFPRTRSRSRFLPCAKRFNSREERRELVTLRVEA